MIVMENSKVEKIVVALERFVPSLNDEMLEIIEELRTEAKAA